MSQSFRWLKCQVSKGQFQDEVAVAGQDYNREEFSFFVSREFVEYLDSGEASEYSGKLKVVLLDQSGQLALVQLPGLTFSNGSTITVSMDDLEECMECEPTH